MRQASKRIPETAEKTVRDIRRATRRHHSAEEKIRIVLEGLRGEVSIAELLSSCSVPVKGGARRGRRSSGSMRADRAVEPTKSENITVTWRRSAWSSGCTLGILDAVAASTDGVLLLVS